MFPDSAQTPLPKRLPWLSDRWKNYLNATFSHGPGLESNSRKQPICFVTTIRCRDLKWLEWQGVGVDFCCVTAQWSDKVEKLWRTQLCASEASVFGCFTSQHLLSDGMVSLTLLWHPGSKMGESRKMAQHYKYGFRVCTMTFWVNRPLSALTSLPHEPIPDITKNLEKMMWESGHLGEGGLGEPSYTNFLCLALV